VLVGGGGGGGRFQGGVATRIGATRDQLYPILCFCPPTSSSPPDPQMQVQRCRVKHEIPPLPLHPVQSQPLRRRTPVPPKRQEDVEGRGGGGWFSFSHFLAPSSKFRPSLSSSIPPSFLPSSLVPPSGSQLSA